MIPRRLGPGEATHAVQLLESLGEQSQVRADFGDIHGDMDLDVVDDLQA